MFFFFSFKVAFAIYVYVCMYVHTKTNTLQLSMCTLPKQVGSIWVNECLFFGNTQGCLIHGVYLRLLWFSLSMSSSKPS